MGVTIASPAYSEGPVSWVGPERSLASTGSWVGSVIASASSEMSRRAVAASKIGKTCVEAPTSVKSGTRALIRQSHGPLPGGPAEQNPGQWHKVCVHKSVGCWHHAHPPKRRRWRGEYRMESRVCRCETKVAVSQFGVRC